MFPFLLRKSSKKSFHIFFSPSSAEPYGQKTSMVFLLYFFSNALTDSNSSLIIFLTSRADIKFLSSKFNTFNHSPFFQLYYNTRWLNVQHKHCSLFMLN